MFNITPARLTSVAAVLLWLLALRIPWLLNLATNVGLLLITLTTGYWLLWYAHRALFNGSVDPTGKCVLITGCDTGFGNMLATQLAEEGFFVFASCLDENGDGPKLLRNSKNIRVIKMDVTKEEDVARAFQTVQDSLGDRTLWAVVANAGVACIGYIEWQPLSRVRSVFDVNTFGVLSVCTTFLPLLKKSRGRLVLVTSILGLYLSLLDKHGRMTLPESLTYCMSKATCNSLADGLRRQYFNRGVHVCTVEPVAYRTRMMDHENMEKTFDNELALLPESVRSAINERSIAKSKHTARVLHSLIMRDQPQEAVDAMKLAIRERLPRSSYKPGGLRNNLMLWLHDIGPTEMVDEAIDAARRLAAMVARK